MWSKYKLPILTVLAVLVIDQWIKIYVKLNYPLGEVKRFANWAIIHFTENPGMAFGFEFGGEAGKLTLSVFRILACIAGAWYIGHIVKAKEHKGFVFSVALILAGALGNILDSAFYGLLFDRGTALDPHFQEYLPYDGIAHIGGNGYAAPMFGCVVDMFYFPLINGTFPQWLPIWGGEEFQFFRPIFNFADASITAGIIIIILFHKKFSPQPKPHTTPADSELQAEQGNVTEENLNKEQA